MNESRFEHWKEGAGVLLYFAFLAYFIPKTKELGWGMQGMFFCIVAGILAVGSLYFVVKFVGEEIRDHRPQMREWFSYMSGGEETMQLSSVGTIDTTTEAELNALLAGNPYASPELLEDDPKQTRLLLHAMQQEDMTEIDAGLAQREIQQASPSIIGENPRRRLVLSENFQPDANDPLATGVFFVGIPGSGKTTVMALFFEQYRHFCLPMVIFDSVGDFKSLVEDGVFPRGLIATPSEMPSMCDVIRHRMQVVVDLRQFRRPGEAFMSHELAGQFIARSLKELMNVQDAIDPDKRFPCLVGLDETHIWAPQTSVSYLSGGTAKDLLDTLVIVATTGRKYGVVPFLATQRIAKVHKDVIGGCETRIFGKTDLDNDISRYRDYINKDTISDEGIRRLRKGKMVVCMNGVRLVVQFFNRASRHTSHTPTVTGALTHLAGTIPPELLKSVTRPIEVAAPVITPVPTYTPPQRPERPVGEPQAVEKHTDRLTEVPAVQWERPIRPTKAQLTPELELALQVYKSGMSYRELAQAMNSSSCGDVHVGKDTAGKYLQQLKAMRLVV